MTKNKYDVICNTVDNGIIVLNKKLEIKFWNRWLEIRTKISADDIVGKIITDVYPNINGKKLLRKIVTALTLKSTTFYTSQVNENLIEIELNKVTDKVFKNMQQNITITPLDYDEELVIVYIYDTTLLSETNLKLKQQNEKIEEKNSQLNLLLNTTMEAIVLLRDKKIIDCNDTAVKFFGFKDKKEFINQGIEKLHLNCELLNTQTEKPIEIKLDLKKQTYALLNVKQTNFNNQICKIISLLDITELKNKEILLQEQSKLASMGEMLSNIAHQWRQPLSIVSVAASSTKIKQQLNQLDDDFLLNSMNKIVETTEHLSNTIEVFRQFLKDDKEKTNFNISENIDKNLSIIESVLIENKIKIIKEYEDIFITNYYNEFSQVIMNILTNAKDAFITNHRDEQIIIIKLEKVNNSIVISILDNAGGIKDSIINRVFEPYFTTKHTYHGTGLGLYMSHKIIKDSMNGNISVSNKNFEYNNKHYKGACFQIEFKQEE
jgi:signal transduction histidine kinase